MPIDLEYWKVAQDLGFGQLALRLPTLSRDETLRVLDEYVAQVDKYVGSPS